MTPLSPTRQVLLGAPTAYQRTFEAVAVRSDIVAEPIQVVSGAVSQDSRRSQRWIGFLTVTTDTLPVRPEDLLTPFGTQIIVNAGVEGDTVPYGRYVVTATRATDTTAGRTVTLTLGDLSTLIAQYAFEAPYLIPGGADLADAVASVVANRTGAAPVLDETGIDLPEDYVMGMGSDPWRELVGLAEAFGYQLYYDREGGLVLQPAGPPQSLIELGRLTSVTAAFNTRPPNVIVVRGETSGDVDPVQAVVMDDDPSSPTYAGVSAGSSPYGRVTRVVSSVAVASETAATIAAQGILSGTQAAGATFELEHPYEPTVDIGDLASVTIAGEVQSVVVDAVSVDVTGATTISVRPYV